jgi:hypothetical protein
MWFVKDWKGLGIMVVHEAGLRERHFDAGVFRLEARASPKGPG